MARALPVKSAPCAPPRPVSDVPRPARVILSYSVSYCQCQTWVWCWTMFRKESTIFSVSTSLSYIKVVLKRERASPSIVINLYGLHSRTWLTCLVIVVISSHNPVILWLAWLLAGGSSRWFPAKYDLATTTTPQSDRHNSITLTTQTTSYQIRVRMVPQRIITGL